MMDKRTNSHCGSFLGLLLGLARHDWLFQGVPCHLRRCIQMPVVQYKQKACKPNIIRIFKVGILTCILDELPSGFEIVSYMIVII